MTEHQYRFSSKFIWKLNKHVWQPTLYWYLCVSSKKKINIVHIYIVVRTWTSYVHLYSFMKIWSSRTALTNEVTPYCKMNQVVYFGFRTHAEFKTTHWVHALGKTSCNLGVIVYCCEKTVLLMVLKIFCEWSNYDKGTDLSFIMFLIGQLFMPRWDIIDWIL